jgi:hypothetical protein
MTALARVKLPLFKDFGNAKSSTGGLPYTHAGNIGAHAVMTVAKHKAIAAGTDHVWRGPCPTRRNNPIL